MSVTALGWETRLLRLLNLRTYVPRDDGCAVTPAAAVAAISAENATRSLKHSDPGWRSMDGEAGGLYGMVRWIFKFA